MKLFSFILFFSIVFCLQFAFAQDAENIEELFEKDIPPDSIEKMFDEIKANLPNDIPKALETAEFANQYSLISGIDTLIAKSNYTLGLVYYFKNYFRVSSRYYKEALESDYSKKNTVFRMKVHNNLGVNYDILKDYEQAIKHYRKSLKAAEIIGDSAEIYEVYINIGLVYTNLKEHDKSEQTTLKALEFFKRADDPGNTALCYQNLAKMELNRKNHQKSVDYSLIAISIFKEIENFYMVGQMYHNIGIVYYDSGQYKKSISYADSAETILAQFGSVRPVSVLMQLKGYNLNKLGNYPKAEEYLLGSIDMFNSIEDYDNTLLSNFQLILLYHDWGKSKKFAQYTTLYDSLHYKVNEIKIKENIEENEELNKVEKNILAVKHHAKLLEQKNDDLKKLGIMTGILVIGIMFIIMLYRNLQSSYRDLYEKNMRENLTVPCISKLEDKDDKNLELYARVRELFEKEKLYMNPKITLTEIAEKLNSNENYISNAINKYSKTNLTGFINKYRIEEAKKHLAEAAVNNNTIDRIAELSGFGNRVTFARVFKTMTNLSPSAFKKMSVS